MRQLAAFVVIPFLSVGFKQRSQHRVAAVGRPMANTRGGALFGMIDSFAVSPGQV
ncbi:hypothetical protein OAE29_05200 [Octadecabacter sp.]|nr:hypothetical protein [Octadecabacter sp.]